MGLILPILIAVQIADGALTYSSVSQRLAREGNPLMQCIAGSGNFLLLKIVGALVCALLLWLVSRRFPRICIISASCIVVFYALVIAWNLNVLFAL